MRFARRWVLALVTTLAVVAFGAGTACAAENGGATGGSELITEW
ncbi:hypothetical protein ACIO3O_34300 [Streptomyces sp. NPDC087440]